MIIDRITSIHVIPPTLVAMDVPIRVAAQDVAAVTKVGSGERQIAEGATGRMLDVSYDELEVELYSPRDLMLHTQHLQPR